MSGNPDKGAGAPQGRQRLAGTERPAKHSRLGGIWLLLVLGAAILVLLLVFILMNGQHVVLHLYGAHVTAPLGVALLLAAALGVLLVVVPGGGRIIQLRRATKRLHREREHLAGRLDEVVGATSPGDRPPAGAVGRRDAGLPDDNTAQAPRIQGAPAEQASEAGAERPHHWWDFGRSGR
jgi:uncharacterized integral membrane protein